MKKQLSEYERMSDKIQQFIKEGRFKGLDPDELAQEQIDSLSEDMGLGKDAVPPLILAVQLSREWNLSLELLYGLASVTKTLRPEQLRKKKPAHLQEVLKEAIDAGIISQHPDDLLEDTAERLHRFSILETPLERLAKDLRINLPEQLNRRLQDSKIRRPLDLLANESLEPLGSWPEGSEEERALRTLAAHARLSLLSPDLKTSKALIDQGYTSPVAITKTPLGIFSETMRSDLGLLEAAKIHIEAQGMTKHLDNIATGMLADAANHFVLSGSLGQGGKHEEYVPMPCNCADCEAAVSPLAYLADLLDYVLGHVKTNGNPITLDFLTQMLHQPFDKLPADCRFSEKRIRQVRLCIEVVRKLLPIMTIQQDYLLTKPYRLAAYKMLLTKIGTSYDELRLVSSAHEDEREALGQRLGLEEKRLNRLFLDADAAPLPPGAPAAGLVPRPSLTEEQLEAVFGLRNTERDPGSEPSTPLLQTWRLEYLREVWRSQDWPIDAYAEEFEPAHNRLPIIDPDVISPDDFRSPDGGEAAFDVWLSRREWVDDRLKALAEKKTIVRGSHTADWATLYAEMAKPVAYRMRRPGNVVHNVVMNPWKNADPTQFGSFRDALTKENDSTLHKQALKAIEHDLHLTVDAFTRLMALHEKDELAGIDQRNEKLSPSERQELFGILLQACKTAVYPTWIDEEESWIKSGKLLFGPKAFWAPLSEPREGEWPPLPYFAQHVGRQPLLDPELVARETVAQLVPGKAGLVLLEQRSAQLRQGLDALKATGNDFDTMLKLALGHPKRGDDLAHDIVALEQDLDGSDDAKKNAAVVKIVGDLYMSVSDFKRLMTFQSPAVGPNDPRHWDEAYRILNSAEKLKRYYGDWLKQEQTLPLIDPEVLKESDIPEGSTGATAKEKLWKLRKGILDTALTQLQEQHKKNELRGLLKEALGHPNPGDNLPHDLDILKAGLDKEDATETEKIGKDMYMPIDDFDRLMFVKAKEEQSDPARKPTSAEWTEVYTILANARKLKREYPQWAQEEQSSKLTYWQLRKAMLPRWRSSLERRQGWQQALASRSHAPVIDPDLIGLADLKVPSSGDAAQLWQQRNNWLSKYVTDLESSRKQAESTAPTGANKVVAGIDQIIHDSLGISGDKLAALEDAQKEGKGIAGRLAQLHVTQAAFFYLVKIRGLAAHNKSIDDEKWKDVYAILVQAAKQREFATWRLEERAKDLLLSSKEYEITAPDTANETIPEPMWEPAAWRATWQARRHWLEALQSRVDQEQAIIDGLTQAIGETEAATLPILRDALLMTLRVGGNSLESKADWVQDHLLIESKSSGCHLTTRVSQAITTLQSFLWELRTNQFTDHALMLEALAFDEEWPWIGSYATWRAAMFVYLYPENVLLPTLRRTQTETFRRLIAEQIRGNKRLNPETACHAANRYSDYLRDVCSLSLEACTEAKGSVLHQNACRIVEGDAHRNLLFLFGRSRISNEVYWTSRDVDVRVNIVPMSMLWAKIPGLEKVINLIGAVTYDVAPNSSFPERYVYLFARVQDKREEKLVFTRYDLEKGLWAPEPTDLDLPAKATTFTAKLKATTADEPPTLGVRLQNGSIYLWGLNTEGDDWDSANPTDPWKQRIDFAEFRDISVSALPNNPKSREEKSFAARDIAERFTAVNDYVNQKTPHLAGGFPNFHEFNKMYGTFLLHHEAAVFSDIPAAQLGNAKSKFAADFSAQDALYRFQQVHRVAASRGYVGGFPNFHEADHGSGTVYGTFLIKQEAAEWRDIATAELGNPKSRTDGSFSAHDMAYRFQAVNDWAASKGYLTGFPTFDEGSSPGGPVYGAILIKPPLDRGEPPGPWKEGCEESGVTPQFPAPAWDSNKVDKVLRIPSVLSQAQAKERRTLIQKAFTDNLGGSRSLLTYFEEAWYFLPLQIALQLQQNGHYIAALDWFRTIYDDSLPVNERKIYYGLKREESLPYLSQRKENWLRDPLNPHAIAETRRFAYTRFTILSLIRCLLDYADAEFTYDTPASCARAKKLYRRALKLLGEEEFKQQPNPCKAIIISLENELYDKHAFHDVQNISLWGNTKKALRTINDRTTLMKTAENISSIFSDGSGPGLTERMSKAAEVVQERIRSSASQLPVTLSALLARKDDVKAVAHSRLLSNRPLAQASFEVAAAAGASFAEHVHRKAGMADESLGDEHGDQSRAGRRGTTANRYRAAPYIRSLSHLQDLIPGWSFPYLYQPKAPYSFCVPPNPVLKGLRLRADLNLDKLNNCRNIAGMEREQEPYEGPTDTVTGLPSIGAGGQLVLPGTRVFQPTPYRFSFLIERAKHLVQVANQIEGSMLSALEKRDAEAYNLLKAKQDIGLARAGIKLQQLRFKEAEGQVKLAELQEQRAQIQVDHYQELLNGGIWALELLALDQMRVAMAFHVGAAALSGAAAMANFATALGAASGLSSLASSASSMAAAYSTQSSVLSTMASYERRRQEWEHQHALAQQDVRIGAQQVKIAEDHVRVVGQEQVIAELQADHAEAVVDFLSNKFTDVELYDWMGDTLETVYSYFLQQATGVAKLAESQLAFERHEPSPAFIKADYWEPPSADGAVGMTNGRSTDRRGLTGSARLLQDIYQLEQYAIDSDKRKLQPIQKTISLAQLAPIELQHFREMGEMRFRTPLELFDRDFPGHYLRIIKRPPKTSVVALIPPIEGIKAELETTGLSRVVIGGDGFQTVTVRREPEVIALSSARDASGTFELEPQSEKLFPFESIGVDTTWILRLPKAANRFDYSTIADVHLTIEYTALRSPAYFKQVVEQLGTGFQADRSFSFRHNFADQWHDLHNPDLTPHPMVVRFRTTRQDFPTNLDGLKIQHVVLYFGRQGNDGLEIPVSHLLFTEEESTATIGGGATSVDGIISTRRGNAGSWTAMTGKRTVGEWELALPDTDDMRKRFKDGVIEDILFVLSYVGETPPWPS
jgi:hypothetical protein